MLGFSLIPDDLVVLWFQLVHGHTSQFTDTSVGSSSLFWVNKERRAVSGILNFYVKPREINSPLLLTGTKWNKKTESSKTYCVSALRPLKGVQSTGPPTRKGIHCRLGFTLLFKFLLLQTNAILEISMVLRRVHYQEQYQLHQHHEYS